MIPCDALYCTGLGGELGQSEVLPVATSRRSFQDVATPFSTIVFMQKKTKKSETLFSTISLQKKTINKNKKTRLISKAADLNPFHNCFKSPTSFK